MDRIAIVGLSIHEAELGELECLGGLAAGEEDLRELADAMAASELVLLRTCNRIELVFGRESGSPPVAADREAAADALGVANLASRQKLRFSRGRSALRHILRVTSSLDSLVLGEDQILAQVRAAYARSRALGLTGPLLEPVFEAALQVGKRVRTETELSRHPISVVALGVRSLREERGRSSDPPRVAVIGAGHTGRLAGHALQDEGWPVSFVVNRSPGPAQALARELEARALTLDEFRRGDEPVDVVVSATNAPGFVLDAAALRRVARNGSFVGIDLAVPRDLEPIDDPGFRLIDIDGLRQLAEGNRRLRADAAIQAEAIVERKLIRLVRRVTDHRIEGLVGEVLAETTEVFEHELQALSTGRLARLRDDELRAIERWARTTFGRLAHAPLAACKRLAHELHERLDEDGEETTG